MSPPPPMSPESRNIPVAPDTGDTAITRKTAISIWGFCELRVPRREKTPLSTIFETRFARLIFSSRNVFMGDRGAALSRNKRRRMRVLGLKRKPPSWPGKNRCYRSFIICIRVAFTWVSHCRVDALGVVLCSGTALGLLCEAWIC